MAKSGPVYEAVKALGRTGDVNAFVKALKAQGITSQWDAKKVMSLYGDTIGLNGYDVEQYTDAVTQQMGTGNSPMDAFRNVKNAISGTVGKVRSQANNAKGAPAPVADYKKTARDLEYDDATSADAWYRDPRYQLDPELALDQLKPDQQAVDAQKRTMNELFDLYKQGGATAQDRAFQANARADSEQWLRGQREADLQDYAERGMSGSGSELLSMLADRGDAAERLSRADLDLQAQHEKRAMEALLNGEDIASDIRSSSFEEAGSRVDLIRSASEDNTNWWRQQYDDTMKRRHEDAQLNRKLGFDAAEGLYGADQKDDQSKYGFAANAANNDADRYNTANSQSASNLTGEDYGGDLYGQATATNQQITQGRHETTEGWSDVHEGVGQAMDGAAQMAKGGGFGGVGGAGSGGTAVAKSRKRPA